MRPDEMKNGAEINIIGIDTGKGDIGVKTLGHINDEGVYVIDEIERLP